MAWGGWQGGEERYSAEVALMIPKAGIACSQYLGGSQHKDRSWSFTSRFHFPISICSKQSGPCCTQSDIRGDCPAPRKPCGGWRLRQWSRNLKTSRLGWVTLDLSKPQAVEQGILTDQPFGCGESRRQLALGCSIQDMRHALWPRTSKPALRVLLYSLSGLVAAISGVQGTCLGDLGSRVSDLQTEPGCAALRSNQLPAVCGMLQF